MGRESTETRLRLRQLHAEHWHHGCTLKHRYKKHTPNTCITHIWGISPRPPLFLSFTPTHPTTPTPTHTPWQWHPDQSPGRPLDCTTPYSWSCEYLRPLASPARRGRRFRIWNTTLLLHSSLSVQKDWEREKERERALSRQEGRRRERGRDGEGSGWGGDLTPRLCLRPSIALVVHIGITLIACVCARARVHINAYPPEIRMAGLHARPRPCMLVLTHACTHERKHAHACTYKRTRSHAHAYTYTPDVQMAGLLGSHAYFPPTGNTDSHK